MRRWHQADATIDIDGWSLAGTIDGLGLLGQKSYLICFRIQSVIVWSVIMNILLKSRTNLDYKLFSINKHLGYKPGWHLLDKQFLARTQTCAS